MKETFSNYSRSQDNGVCEVVMNFASFRIDKHDKYF
jgi:hypothetical protein